MTRRCQGGNEEVATCPGYKVASAPATDRYNIHMHGSIFLQDAALQATSYLRIYLRIWAF